MNVFCRIFSLFVVAAALVSSSCGPGGGGGDKGCRAELLVGDLVITELMANPDGTDTGKEWFEIFNNSSSDQELTGLRLILSRADGTGEKGHTVAGVTLPAGAYLTFGSFVDPVPSWIGYSYGTGLGTMRNSDARVALRCNDTVVDEVTYASSSDGKSLSFSGALAPDYAANDVADNWCKSTVEYEPGSMGSPGAKNETCAGGPNPTECDDAGVVRSIVTPLPGDLVITELMPNPDAAADSSAEWFEVYVGRDLDLNGIELGQTPGTPKVTLSADTCMRVLAGTHVVFARDADPLLNGGLDPVAGTFSFGMTNGGGTLFVGRDGAVLDAVSWSGSSAGTSISLDPGARDPTANDDLGKWCAGVGSFGQGDRGTPGAANAACPLLPPAGSCVDAGVSIRPIDPPGAGDLQITEIMANPAMVGDPQGEWFELKVMRDLDLNGLEIGTDTVSGAVRDTLGDNACLRVTAGSHVVLARNADTVTNGGLPPAIATFGFALLNSNAGLFVGYGGTILDPVTYTSTSSGASLSRDPTTATLWCDLSAFTAPPAPTYGSGDLGSPADANPACQ